jgi:hypothetical protein
LADFGCFWLFLADFGGCFLPALTANLQPEITQKSAKISQNQSKSAKISQNQPKSAKISQKQPKAADWGCFLLLFQMIS